MLVTKEEIRDPYTMQPKLRIVVEVPYEMIRDSGDFDKAGQLHEMLKYLIDMAEETK